MLCGICKKVIRPDGRKEHLTKYHGVDNQLIEWIIHTDDELISLKPKNLQRYNFRKVR
jgi:hypothetical protein